jgi:hypothetical protein
LDTPFDHKHLIPFITKEKRRKREMDSPTISTH